MEEEVCILQRLKEQLTLLNNTSMDNKQFALTILTALPESWNAFIGSIDAQDLKSIDIIGRILSEDAYQKSRSLGSTALVATIKLSNQLNHSKPQFQSSSSNTSNNHPKSKFCSGVFCHYYKKEKHIRPECHSLAQSKPVGNNPQSNQSNQTNQTTQVHLASDLDNYAFAVLEPFSLDKTTDLWLGNTVSQSHIVRDRKFFLSYTPIPGNYVEGTERCSALGHSTVKLNFIVDGVHNSITFLDVIHTPKMPHNLVSFRQLTSASYSYFGIDNEVMISKGNHIIRCRHKIGNLYALHVATPIQAYTIHIS